MDAEGARERPRSPETHVTAWPRRAAIGAALVILAGIGTFVWFDLLQREQGESATAPAPPAQTAPNTAAQADVAAAAPTSPVAPPAKLEPAAPLPALEKSDEVLQNLLAYLVGPGAFGKLFQPTELVHRFVATVDNLPRAQLPRRLVPLKAAEGQFVVGPGPAGSQIVPANFDRYRPYVLAAEAIDTKQLVAGYVRFYPWFRDDYRALGYPSGAFHERLLAAIDDLLAAPDIEEPLALKQPKVLYQFADPDLEALSAGQKIMLRIGPHYAARVKTKLREIRHELAQAPVEGR
jgi:hypothetical protein